MLVTKRLRSPGYSTMLQHCKASHSGYKDSVRDRPSDREVTSFLVFEGHAGSNMYPP